MRHVVPAESLIIEPRRPSNPRAFAQTVLTVGQNGLSRRLLVSPDLRVLDRKDEAAACQILRMGAVEVEIIDTDELLDGGNGHHAFTPTEMVVVGRLLEAVLQPVADEHRAAGRTRAAMVKAGHTVEHMPVEERLKVRPVVAKALGVGGTTYGAARDVVMAAEADPDHYGDLPAEMDGTGSVHAAHEEFKRRRQALLPAEEMSLPPLPRPKAPGLSVKFAAGRGPSVVIQNAIYSLQAAADTVTHMDISGVTAEDAESWVDDLFDTIKTFVGFRVRLKAIAKEDHVD